MKAQFVYENINFERGKDPKKVMGIGLKSFYDNLSKGDVLKVKKNLSGLKYYKGYLVIIAGNVNDSTTINGEPSKWISSLSVINNEGKEIGKEDPWNISFDFFKEYLQPAMNESYNFERGIDPYKSLDIGLGDLMEPYIATDQSVKELGFEPIDIKETKKFEELSDIDIKFAWRKDNIILVLFLYENIDQNPIPSLLAVEDTGRGYLDFKDAQENEWNKFLDPLNYGGDNIYKAISKMIVESYNFERDIDPKRALRIGLSNAEAAKGLKELAKKYDLEFKIFDNGEYGKYASIETISGFNKIPIYIVIEEYPFDEGEYQARAYQFSSSWGLPGGDHTLEGELKAAEKFIIRNNKELKESINFERGTDPKEAISVGLKSQSLEIEGVYYKGGKIRRSSKWHRVPDEDAHEILDNMNLTHVNSYAVKHFPKDYNNVIAYHTISSLKSSAYKDKYKWVLFDGKYYRIPRLSDPPEYYFKNNKTVSNESISFERGKDPKESMDIGMMKVIESIIDEFAEKHSWIKNERDRKHGYLEWKKGERYSIQLRWNLEEKKPLLFLEVFNLKRTMKTGENIIKFIRSGGLENWFFSQTYESVSFERGRDPKSSLGIGIISRIKKGSILQPKVEMMPRLSLSYTGNKKFKIKPGQYCLVKKIDFNGSIVQLEVGTYSDFPVNVDTTWAGGEHLTLTTEEFLNNFEVVRL